MDIIDLTKKVVPLDVIDLTEDPVDYISGLPPEIIHHICSYLFASHEPNKIPSLHDAEVEGDSTLRKEGLRPKKGQKDYHHDLDHLAATSTYLRAQVNEWATHFLLQHQAITKYKQPKVFQYGVKRNILRSGRPTGLLNWSVRHCCFCGKKSVRSAILMNGLRCCRPCDDKHWPDKMTKTAARNHGRLRDDQLMPREAAVSPTCRNLYAAKCGSSGIRYGIYLVYNQPTTMFLKKDVEALALRVHGPDIMFPVRGTQHHFRRAQLAAESTNATTRANGGGGGMSLGHGSGRSALDRTLHVTVMRMLQDMRAAGRHPPDPAAWARVVRGMRQRLEATGLFGLSSFDVPNVNGIITATVSVDSGASAPGPARPSSALAAGLIRTWNQASVATLLVPSTPPPRPPPLRFGQATITRISSAAPPPSGMDLLPPSAPALGRGAVDVEDNESGSSPEELDALDASELFGLAVAPKDVAVYD